MNKPVKLGWNWSRILLFRCLHWACRSAGYRNRNGDWSLENSHFTTKLIPHYLIIPFLILCQGAGNWTPITWPPAMCNTVIPHPGINFLSGRRESNSALVLPKHIYYQYTTARTLIFGLPRIELGSHAPEACILPLYYSPWFITLAL